MAWDLLSVPVTSAEIEHIFSECAVSLSDKRLGMTPETLEQLMLHRSWEHYIEGWKSAGKFSLLCSHSTNYL